ncbi:MAG: MaoC family dehydratase [Hylemonella sp.]
MTALLVDTPADMAPYVGQQLGSSDWIILGQDKVDAFAALTGDDHWIHLDVERARREMPAGKTLVHGFLTLSLIPYLQRSVFQIAKRGKGLNYGCNRIRFTSPLAVGSRIRLHQTLQDFADLQDGVRLILNCTIEVEGQSRPALVAETIVQIFNE